jgi:hypothetical protein
VSPVVGIELGRLSIDVREKNGRALDASLAMNIAPLVPYLFLGSFFSLLLLALWILA